VDCVANRFTVVYINDHGLINRSKRVRLESSSMQTIYET